MNPLPTFTFTGVLKQVTSPPIEGLDNFTKNTNKLGIHDITVIRNNDAEVIPVTFCIASTHEKIQYIGAILQHKLLLSSEIQLNLEDVSSSDTPSIYQRVLIDNKCTFIVKKTEYNQNTESVIETFKEWTIHSLDNLLHNIIINFLLFVWNTDKTEIIDIYMLALLPDTIDFNISKTTIISTKTYTIEDICYYQKYRDDGGLYHEDKGNYADLLDKDLEECLESILVFIYFEITGYCTCVDPCNELCILYECMVAMYKEEWNWSCENKELEYYRYIVLKLLDKAEVLDHGTTAHCAWLTDYGKTILHDLIIIFKLCPEYNMDTNFTDDVIEKLLADGPIFITESEERRIRNGS